MNKSEKLAYLRKHCKPAYNYVLAIMRHKHLFEKPKGNAELTNLH